MPPRKSTRPDGATPIRQTREGTTDTGETSTSRRSVRQTALKAASIVSTRTRRSGLGRPSLTGDNQLPVVQTRASYAYGANKGPVMPETLGTINKNSIADMADAIGEEIDEENEEELEPPYKQQEDEDDEEDEIVVQPREREYPEDSSQLSEIPEEDSQSELPEPSSPPSAFPSDLPDHSYMYERNARGVRRLKPTALHTSPLRLRPATEDQQPRPSKPVSGFVITTKAAMQQKATQLRDTVRVFSSSLVETTKSICGSISKMPLSALGNFLVATFGMLFIMTILASSICFMYGRLGCESTPTSGLGQSIHSGFQQLCGSCQTYTAPIDLSNIAPGDVSKISTAIDSINKKVVDLERRLSYRIDNKYTNLDSELSSLKQQQLALTNHLADHVDSQSGPSSGYVASPLIPKINFFAPSNGAVVNVVRTSPTKERIDSYGVRVAKRLVGGVKHRANPPVTALVPWQDVGDCWCAANAVSGDFVRLAVSTKEMLYPVELVIEHLPASGSLDRGSIPKQMELWADFSHFSEAEWRAMQLVDKQEGNVLGPNFARIGTMKYDASSSSSHVQSFPLDVNQYDLLHSSRSFVVRVTSNYGAENVCLYRVRLHGQPVAAPNAGMVDHWYEEQGYVKGE